MAQDKIKISIKEFETRLENLYNVQFKTGDLYRINSDIVSSLGAGSMKQRVYYYYLRGSNNGNVAIYYPYNRYGVIY